MGKGRKEGTQSDAEKGQLLSLFYKEKEQKRKSRKDPQEWNKTVSVTSIKEKY